MKLTYKIWWFLETIQYQVRVLDVCCAKSLQSCPTLCDPTDGSPPVSSVHGVLQARTLGWVAMPSSRGSSRPRDRACISCVSCTGRRSCTSASWEALVRVRSWRFSGSVVSDCAAPGTAARRLLSRGFSRKESWSGLPFPSPLLSVWKAIQTTCKYKKARMKQCRAYIK